MKELKYIVVRRRFESCPRCERAKQSTPYLPTIDVEGPEKFCDKCGMSLDHNVRVPMCPFCHEPVMDWRATLFAHIELEGMGKNIGCSVLLADEDGDLWIVPIEHDYDIRRYAEPEPITDSYARDCCRARVSRLRGEIAQIESWAETHIRKEKCR